MSIFSRFADIINANINALLDKAEDPEKLIRLIIQEMEDTLVEVRTTSAKVIAEKKEVGRRIDIYNTEAADWERKAELALSKGREDLAKAALLECNKTSEVAEELQCELLKTESELARLSREIDQLQEKLSDAKVRQKSLLMRHKTTSSRLKLKHKLRESSTEHMVSRFDAFERKLDELESEVEAYDVGRNRKLADEINELAKSEKIDLQLDALKDRLQNDSKTQNQENIDG